MYVLNDIAYASNNEQDLKIEKFKIIADLCMLITFSNGEKRIFDATNLLKYPIYQKLKEYDVFNNAYIENGILVWNEGKIDISPETVYCNSFEYELIVDNIK